MMEVVAEMMIWANSAVAKRIAEAFPAAALLRRHPPPRLDTFQEVATDVCFTQSALASPVLSGSIDRLSIPPLYTC